MTEPLSPGTGDILLVVDIQNDFCPGGRLAVSRGDEIVDLVNDLGGRFRHVAMTQDWHPAGHQSFASSHPGREPYEVIEAEYGQQVLWPDHCVQGTPGAEFHPSLAITHCQLILRKGYDPRIDSYSAFFENDRTTPTGLTGYLRERRLKRIMIVGLAFDFCVRYSAEDARASGFDTVVIEDACRAIDIEGSLAAARESFSELGIRCVNSQEIRAG